MRPENIRPIGPTLNKNNGRQAHYLILSGYELGVGFFCLLEMPQRVTRERLPQIVQELNRRELAPRDQPPHFGAWSKGNSDSLLA